MGSFDNLYLADMNRNGKPREAVFRRQTTALEEMMQGHTLRGTMMKMAGRSRGNVLMGLRGWQHEGGTAILSDGNFTRNGSGVVCGRCGSE